MEPNAQDIIDGASLIVAQLEALRNEIANIRRALECLPSLIEAVRNLYEVVRAVERING